MNINRINTIIDKYLVDYVYNAARIEGVNTKYLDTKLFVDEGIEPNLDSDKVNILKNLKDAYKLLKDEKFLSETVDVYSLKRINQIVNGRGLVNSLGEFRVDEVYITNCNYIPPIPVDYDVNECIFNILNSEGDVFDKGIDLYLYIMRTQPFIDGNKRTANVFANMYLLKNDQPMISIHADKKKQFLMLLSRFYETNDSTKIKEFIKKYGVYNVS